MAPDVYEGVGPRHEARSARKALADHLFDAHGVLLTRAEFRSLSLDELRALDPCVP